MDPSPGIVNYSEQWWNDYYERLRKQQEQQGQPQAQPAAAPTPPEAAPAIGGMGTASGAMAAAPAAAAGLSSVAQGEGFREGFMREGWGDQGAPSLSIPNGRQQPASSRALAQIASAKGRVY